ncbi:MAG: hypothetical protein JSW68_11365, partial [Burkholderiales bacterium]
MTEASVPAADRPRLFGEAREHLGRALADMMPHVASRLGRLLDDASERLEGAEASHLRQAAQALRDAVPDLARQVPAALNELVLRRMEWLAAQRAGEQVEATLALYDESELGEQLALEETASAIR